MRPARINITGFFTQPSVVNIAISLVVGGLLWFLFNAQNIVPNTSFLTENISHTEFTEFTEDDSLRLSGDTAIVPMMFMKHFVVWELSMMWSRVIGFVAIVGLMVWLMFLCNQLQIIPVRSSMVLTVGLVMAGCIGYIQPFDESYIAIVLFLFALKELIQMYHFENQVSAVFNIVLLMGAAALFEPAFAWLSLLFVLGMVIFRVISGRVFLSILLGIATLCAVIGSMFWLTDSLEILTKYLDRLVNITLWHDVVITRADIVVGVFTMVMMLYTFVSYHINASNYKLNTRLNFAFINWGFWLSLVWVVCFGAEFTQLIAVPGLFAVMCFSLYFSMNQGKVANVMFVVWFLVFVGYRVMSLFI